MRTDYTATCARCGARHSPREPHACTAGERPDVVQIPTARAPAPETGNAPTRFELLAAAAVSAVIAASYAAVASWAAATFFGVMTVLAGGLAFVSSGGRPGARARGAARSPRRRVRVERAVPPGATTCTVGTVEELGAPLISPGGRRCVAFHARGDLDGRAVDDAALVPFRVRVGPDAVVVRGDAFVELDALDAVRTRQRCVGGRWPEGFLESRGLPTGPITFALLEQVLVAGDVVEVHLGVVEPSPTPSPYREAAEPSSPDVCEETPARTIRILARAPKT